jgi:hypothetical protein
MAQDWDIRPRGRACTCCDAEFADQQECFSELTFGEEGYQRSDYCMACAKTRASRGTIVSTWQGVFQAPPAKPDTAVKKETAESLLRRFMEDDDESHRNIIYILAVMLERNKTLVERDVQTREDGTLVRVYEHRKTGETFLVPDPRLRLDELESVQEEVVVLLGGEPRSKTPPGAPPEGGEAAQAEHSDTAEETGETDSADHQQAADESFDEEYDEDEDEYDEDDEDEDDDDD